MRLGRDRGDLIHLLIVLSQKSGGNTPQGGAAFGLAAGGVTVEHDEWAVVSSRRRCGGDLFFFGKFDKAPFWASEKQPLVLDPDPLFWWYFLCRVTPVYCIHRDMAGRFFMGALVV